LRWKRLGLIKMYISGDITAPAHLFTGIGDTGSSLVL
jgi:hypothetical protein